jgi:hypothetical protein
MALRSFVDPDLLDAMTSDAVAPSERGPRMLAGRPTVGVLARAYPALLAVPWLGAPGGEARPTGGVAAHRREPGARRRGLDARLPAAPRPALRRSGPATRRDAVVGVGGPPSDGAKRRTGSGEKQPRSARGTPPRALNPRPRALRWAPERPGWGASRHSRRRPQRSRGSSPRAVTVNRRRVAGGAPRGLGSRPGREGAA